MDTKATSNNERIGRSERRGQREQGGFRRGLVRVRLVRWSIHQRFASGLRQLAVG